MPVDGFQFGGQRYEVPQRRVEAVLDVDHTTSGYSLRLRFEAELDGPCMRCLEPAGKRIAVDVREVDQPDEVEELSSDYLTATSSTCAGWARDALALALPAQIVCRDDCLGLCAVCGENLNEAGPGARARARARSALGGAAGAEARMSRRRLARPSHRAAGLRRRPA